MNEIYHLSKLIVHQSIRTVSKGKSWDSFSETWVQESNLFYSSSQMKSQPPSPFFTKEIKQRDAVAITTLIAKA
jgi:hypothetical protein